MSRPLLAAALAVLSLGGAGAGAEASCPTDLCFADLGAQGEIQLGPQQGGVAVLDYNGDGYQDLVFANAGGPRNQLRANVADPSVQGGRGFLDVSSVSGLDDADAASRVSLGVIAGDYDGDGDLDLYFTGRASDDSFGLLYRNEGRGRFTNVSIAAGIRGSGLRAQSASFVDFDLDGDLDLFVTGNVSSSPIRLYVNDGDGTFSDETSRFPAIAGVSNSYAHLFTDFDGDGDSDAFLLTAGSGPRVLRNDIDALGSRVFREVAAEIGFTVLGPAPMGIAGGDYDGDGDFDLAITDAQDGTYYRNDGGFMTLVNLLPSQFGWGVVWLDADNDGDLDHYQAGSFAQASNGGPAQRDKLFENEGGGVFRDVSPSLNGIVAASRWSVGVDIDDDGRVDLVTLNPGDATQSVSVYRNLSPSTAPWLKILLRGTGASNADAAGALVRLYAGGSVMTQEVRIGSSTASSEDPRLHFGLGTATSVDLVEVVWPRHGSVEERTERYRGPFPLRRVVTLQPHDPSLPCQNGLDDDGDGNADHPADAGCVTATDPSEQPECSDGLDNDGDGRLDHPVDPQCAAPEGATESGACGLLGVEALLPLALLARRRRRSPPRRLAAA